MRRWWYVQRVTATLLRSLGYRTAQQMMTHLADGVFDLHPAIRDLVERNIARADSARRLADAGPDDTASLAREMFRHTARFWTELLFLSRRFRPSTVLHQVEWEDPARWEALAGLDRPLVLVSPYLGNPAVGTLALCRRLTSLSAAVDEGTRFLADAVWPGAVHRGTLRWDPNLRIVTLPRESSRLDEVLAARGRLCLLVGPRAGGTGRSRRFLGRTCRIPTSVLRLAARHHARFVVWSCRRGDDALTPFRIVLHAEMQFEPAVIRRGLDDLLGAVESAVRVCPRQYLWTR